MDKKDKDKKDKDEDITKTIIELFSEQTKHFFKGGPHKTFNYRGKKRIYWIYEGDWRN